MSIAETTTESSRAESLARVCLSLAGSVLMAAALLKLAGWNVSAFAQSANAQTLCNANAYAFRNEKTQSE